jgi:hypothetical protein
MNIRTKLVLALVPALAFFALAAYAFRASPGVTVLAGAVICVVLMVVLHRQIVAPLEQLTRTFACGELNADAVPGLACPTDEFTVLAREFDRLRRAAAPRPRLAAPAGPPPAAGITPEVLQSVGKILEGVSASTASLVQGVQNSRMASLSRAVELVGAHRTDLANSVAQDENGCHPPTHLMQLTEVLLEEQRCLLAELQNLSASVQQISQVFQGQPLLADVPGQVEPTSIRELIDAALLMTQAAFKRHGIRVDCELAETPTGLLDRGKCLRVLANLLTNAEEALRGMPEGQRRVVVRARSGGEHRVVIEVSDNGAGIEPHLLPRIFQSGFTTKPGGQGNGLPFCAQAAKELGGVLTARSDGPGRGATFTWDLPLEPAGRHLGGDNR